MCAYRGGRQTQQINPNYKYIEVYSRTDGLNNFADPTRVAFDPKTGVTDLTLAYNIDISPTGRISRRKGFSRLGALASASFFCQGGECLFIRPNPINSLCRLNSDLTSYLTVRSGLTPGNRMWYVQVPTGTIYYANGAESGYVVKGIDYAWTPPTYVGPSTFKQYYPPPPLTQLCLYNSRIYGVGGRANDTIWYSEKYNWNSFELGSAYISFGAEIMLFAPVFSASSGSENSGIYVGTSQGLFFLQGSDPLTFTRQRIHAETIPVLGTAAQVNSEDVGNGDIFDGQGIMWTANDGVWVGGAGGRAKNLTKRKLVLPKAREGTACFYKGKYVSLLFS